VAVVTTRAAEFPLAGLLQRAGYPVLLIGSISDAYLRIKHEAPDRIVVYLTSDDVDGCHLLSALAVDPDTAHIPVVTYMLHPADDHEPCDADAVARLESSAPN
jgi:hypothetical protein